MLWLQRAPGGGWLACSMAARGAGGPRSLLVGLLAILPGSRSGSCPVPQSIHCPWLLQRPCWSSDTLQPARVCIPLPPLLPPGMEGGAGGRAEAEVALTKPPGSPS